MGVVLDGTSEFHFVYTAHQHEETEPCNSACRTIIVGEDE